MGTFTEDKNNLEWTNPRRLSLPNQMSTQGFLQNKNVGEVRHTSSTARQGLPDPAAGISTLTDN